jgi:cytochrome c oxidase subunit IV
MASTHHQIGESEHHEGPAGTRWIWLVFWLLLAITGVEVALGIIKPGILMRSFIGTTYLNVLFILLTLVKAYYIVAYFMHLKFERKGMIYTIALPMVILIPYLLFIVLTEGFYINNMLH